MMMMMKASIVKSTTITICTITVSIIINIVLCLQLALFFSESLCFSPSLSLSLFSLDYVCSLPTSLVILCSVYLIPSIFKSSNS